MGKTRVAFDVLDLRSTGFYNHLQNFVSVSRFQIYHSADVVFFMLVLSREREKLPEIAG